MELDWSTFLLEIINFLVLVWLLKRLLYRPVLAVIARRRAETDEAMAAAQRAQSESETLKQRYEERLQEWAKERNVERGKLRRELDEERSRRLAEIRKAIDDQREKARIADERHRREMQESAEQEGLALGARFAGRLLERTAGPETTRALVALAVEEMGALPREQRDALRHAADKISNGVIATAHTIDESQRDRLRSALNDLFGASRQWEWRVSPELIGGTLISLGGWELAANVRDELKGLVSLSHGAPIE